MAAATSDWLGASCMMIFSRAVAALLIACQAAEDGSMLWSIASAFASSTFASAISAAVVAETACC